ncbi:MAG: hypothetical protein WCF90_00340 [Methanomicrobiales archaeon]
MRHNFCYFNTCCKNESFRIWYKLSHRHFFNKNFQSLHVQLVIGKDFIEIRIDIIPDRILKYFWRGICNSFIAWRSG